MAISTTRDDGTRDVSHDRRPTRVGAGSGPVVVEARGVSKTFQVPEHRVDTLKERATHPLARRQYRQLHAVDDLSFEIHKGEFFGIVGRNGSGKSTLLKMLASIYRPDAGTLRVAGRMAPFIELGVGFNMEMTALDNIVLNGVLLGLSRREARRRLDAVLDFAELRRFVDLKLKNYSSGMIVRLAFSIMVEADVDIMLIDEVLAVGDAAFAQKCMDVFHERRNAGRTIVLVTHDMAAVQTLCHRAMLLHDGRLEYIGDPEDAALRYYRLNFGHHSGDEGTPAPKVEINGRAVQARLLNDRGQSVANIEPGAPIHLDVVIEAARELEHPSFILHVVNADHVVVFGVTRGMRGRVKQGQRVRLSGTIENRLVPGRYAVDCWIRRERGGGFFGVQGARLLQFGVAGAAPRHGVVTLRGEIEPTLEPE